jgi:hypothetical protein
MERFLERSRRGDGRAAAAARRPEPVGPSRIGREFSFLPIISMESQDFPKNQLAVLTVFNGLQGKKGVFQSPNF